MSDGGRLLAAITGDPADDAVRLVYADWLEEYGDAGQRARAEFIRVQVEIATLMGHTCPDLQSVPRCWRCERIEELAFREADLWDAKEAVDGEFNGPFVIAPEVCSPWQAPREMLDREEYSRSDGFVGVVWRRGFPGRVRLPLADWLRYGPALVAAHPLTRVELSDRGPMDFGDGRFGWCWRWAGGLDLSDPDTITYELWRELRLPMESPNGGWKVAASREVALDALSAACLAREKAKAKEAA